MSMDTPDCDPDRRLVLAGLALAAATPAAAAAAPAAGGEPIDAELQRAFVALLRPETQADMLLADAIIVDSDAPFPMGRAEQVDHLAFHQPLWESRDWKAYDLRTRRIGDSGFVSAYLMERGKPKGAGFRLQPLYATATLVRTTAGWKALSLHLGAIRGQLTDISPG